MAPLRPGTVAPGADGMTDSATANGDDRDPEIELFVKVGRRLGGRGSRGTCDRARAGAGSRAPAQRARGRWTLPGERSAARAVPWVAVLQARAWLQGSRGEWSQVQSGRWLSSWRVGRQFVKAAAGQAVTAAAQSPARATWDFPKGHPQVKGDDKNLAGPAILSSTIEGVGE